MARFVLLLSFLVALALSTRSQGRLPEVDLSVNGIRSGTSYSVILQKLGKPLRIKNKGLDECTSSLMRTVYYSGLTIELENYKKGRVYGVVAMTVTSSRWKLNAGLTIGANMKTVRATLGKPLGKGYSDARTLDYVTKGNEGGVDFYFRRNKLVRVRMSETLC